MTERYGEDKLLILAGGMHIELIAYKILGNWLDGSGLTNVITTSGNALSGVADSFIKVTQLTRTRHAHQTTAATLHRLQYAPVQILEHSASIKIVFTASCESYEGRQFP